MQLINLIQNFCKTTKKRKTMNMVIMVIMATIMMMSMEMRKKQVIKDRYLRY